MPEYIVALPTYTDRAGGTHWEARTTYPSAQDAEDGARRLNWLTCADERVLAARYTVFKPGHWAALVSMGVAH